MIFGHVNPVEPGLTGLLFISEIVPEDIFRLKKFLLLFVFIFPPFVPLIVYASIICPSNDDRTAYLQGSHSP